MLRVARLSDRTGRYYLTDLAAELDAALLLGDGRSGRSGAADRAGREAGLWTGGGATGLRLEGRVDEAAFGAILSGAHPRTGEPLRLRRTEVSGYDLTFAAPKSASVAFALGGPDVAAAVLGAHREAVGAAMSYVEGYAASVRRSDPDGRSVQPVRGVVAGSFTHGVSRALDPHLHSHVVVANLAQGPDGRWTAVDGRGLYAHARAAGALYDAALRFGISERTGLQWECRRSGGYELSGIAPELAGSMSGRQAEIRAHLAARVPGASGAGGAAVSRRARAVAWAATRGDKLPALTPATLRQHWQDRARDAGAPGRLDVSSAARSRSVDDVDEYRFAAVLCRDGQRAVFRRDVIAAWAGAVEAGTTSTAVTHCVGSLVDWGRGAGVAEEAHAPASVVPPPHLVRELGPRPASPQPFDGWQAAARAIERYRERWPLEDPRRALGVVGRPPELAAMPPRRLAEHLAVRRQVDETLLRLGRARDRERDPVARSQRSRSPDDQRRDGLLRGLLS